MRFIALLRGINVGGKQQIAMSDLREMLTVMKFEDVTSLLQSGNLLFSTKTVRPETLERTLESATQKQFNKTIDFLIRTAPEWEAIVRRNPYPAEAKSDPSHLTVTCLKAEPTPEAIESLRTAILGRETVEAVGRQLYIVYPDGIGTSKLTHAMIEKKLGVRGTARNWNTVMKIAGAMKA